MSKEIQEASRNTASFGTSLTIAFIVLKLCKVITWSWVWVLAPTWIPIAITVLILIIIAIRKWREL